MDPKECVMYILVNSDLKMKAGKIGAQCAHSACEVVKKLESFTSYPPYYRHWLHNGQPKIVLKCDESTMKQIIGTYSYCPSLPDDKWCFHTLDAGRTQVEAGSLTTIAFRPMARESTPEFINKLKLL